MTNDKLRKCNEIARQIEYIEQALKGYKRKGRFWGIEYDDLIDNDPVFCELVNDYVSKTMNERLAKLKKEFEEL